MKLIVTIDTEEDGWGRYEPQGHTLENIKNIPALQDLFDEYDVKPTYLITYPVASNRQAASLFSGILDGDKCEIGTHCHPWNTPPFKEEPCERNSMLRDLPSELQYEKIKNLHETIGENVGIAPVSFRAGRWGYGKTAARHIHGLGYKIDTSIVPYIDWIEYHDLDVSDISPKPFRMALDDDANGLSGGYILEIPPTVGYLQKNYAVSNHVRRILSGRPMNKMRIVGILDRLNLLNRVWLSPELSDGRTMIRLTERMLKLNYPVVNMVFHSPSLKAGLTPYVRTTEDEIKFMDQIREYLIFARNSGIKSMKLSEAVNMDCGQSESDEISIN